MRCTNCGAFLQTADVFCPNCGIRLGAPVTPGPAVSGFRRNSNTVIALSVSLIAVAVCAAGIFLAVRPVSAHLAGEPSEPLSTAVGSANNGPGNTVSQPEIIGLWSTEGPYGELIDPATGMTTGSVYSGEWYLFRDDGTYRYVIISSGQFLSGGAVCEGRYSVGDGEIFLTDIRESWYPDPSMSGQREAYKNKKAADTVITYYFEEDTGTLVIDKTSCFTKVRSQ